MPKTNSDSRPGDFTVRICRVETWLAHAEKAFRPEKGDRDDEEANESGDPDVAFLLYWIAFNAAYARDLSPKKPPALRSMKRYFHDLLGVDRDRAIQEAIWNHCHDQIYFVVNIQYLFMPYWDYANSESGKVAWEECFNKDREFVREALRHNRYDHIQKVLRIVFARLYVLRNQLVHGGAQFESHYNRDSVFDGAHILASLVPVFLRIMRASHGAKWGKPFFRPALKDKTPSITRHPLYQDRAEAL